jgi:O-glycosyl hydrolase
MMFQNPVRKAKLLLAVVLVLLVFTFGMLIPRQRAYAASAVTINGSTTYQTMDGFGMSEAFGEATAIQNASSTVQKQILDLLFSPTTGAGFTILRNLLPSTSADTIEPNAPASPMATPTYVPLGSSEGQVWLAQQAQSYGVTQLYGDAWSAPGFMKTNGSEANGGAVCGTPGASCSTGDWRQAYANYLVQYAKDYASAGVPLTQIGAFNEPDFSASYSSMVMTPAQTTDFVKVLKPTLTAAGLSTPIVCCDPTGWPAAQNYASAIASDATANADVSIHSSHGYSGAPNSTLSGANGKHIWETEWGDLSGNNTWDPAWDDGSAASGFTWAQNVYTGITAANLSAFLYWWGADAAAFTTDNGILINSSNVASKRLWALANYSRYIHPGATRIGAASGDSNLQVTSYRNTDGTLAVVVLNQSYNAIPATFALQNVTLPTSAVATPYVTDASNNTAAQPALAIQNGTLSATIGSRQLVTYRIATGTAPTPTPTAGTTPTPTPTIGTTPTPTPTQSAGASCSAHYAINNQWSGGFGASFTITNTGTTSINGWRLQFSFPNGQTITQLWNGSYTQSGSAVTITNLSYNASIPPGSSLSSEPGFNGTWNGTTNSPPTAFTLNGVACAVV